MKRERGQALILVLILLAVGAMVTVPVLQLVDTNLRARMDFEEFIKEDYAAEAATEYALWKLRWDPTFAASLVFGVPSGPLYVSINGVTASSTVTAEATETLSGFSLIDHQIKPTKTVTPTTALPDIPTTFTYTITLERLEPDDGLFIPLQSIKDGTDAGFVYVPNSSELDGVPFDDNDLTILAERVIVTPQNFLSWSTIADEDSMVRQDAPAQNYGDNLTMEVSSGLPSANVTDLSFLKFDISGIPQAANIIIQSATLRLCAESYPDVTRTYDLHLVTDNWTEGNITWNDQPGVAATATASADTASDTGTPMEWNVLTDVLDWLSDNTTNHGWRISDDAEGLGTESYTSTVNDTLEFDTLKGKTPDIIPISGDIYAIAYAGDGDDGFLKTVQIASSGNITDTVIDTLEFDILKGMTPDIIRVSGDVYAIAYAGDGDDGFLTTVKINPNGNIPEQIDTLEFDILKGKTPNIIPISGDIYAIAYAGDGDDGFLTTVQIANDGQITDAVIDTLEFDTDKGKTPNIINISGDVYAIVYDGKEETKSEGFLKTVEISAGGTITNGVIDTLLFDISGGKTPDIIPVSGDVYAIAYAGDGDDGFLKTVVITDDGNILETVTNIPEFDTLKGMNPDIIHISGDIYAIAYAGDGDDGFLKTVDLVAGSNIEHITVFHTKDDGDPGGEEPVLVVGYTILGGSELQTIEWIFEPDLDFDYGQERTLSFQSIVNPTDDTMYWNAAIIQPNNSYTGFTANITVGNPPDTGIPGSGATVTKTADPQIVYAGIPTLVTYVISITNNDTGEFNKLDYIEDWLPVGFSYVVGSATLEWPDLNSTDNPAFQTYGSYHNIGDFEPDFTDDPSGRLVLKWHGKPSANGLFPGDDKLLHDRPFPAGVTYTQTFQASANVSISGNYPNEVFTKLKDNLFDRGLDPGDMIYSWPTGEVVVPAYDILTETEHTILRSNAAITQAGIILRSWHWKKHK